jgi:DNA-binding transcriptional regulator YiaG
MLTFYRCMMHNIGAMKKAHYENNKPELANVDRTCPTCGSIRKDPVALAIRAIRNRLGLTQSAFAEMLAVHQSMLSRFETGAEKPCTERLIHLLRMVRTDSERQPIVAALKPRGVLASDLATSISAPISLHDDGRKQGGCNVQQ